MEHHFSNFPMEKEEIRKGISSSFSKEFSSCFTEKKREKNDNG